VNTSEFGATADEIRLALEAENIESRPLWKPMHMQPVYQKMQAPMYGGAVSEDLFAKGLCLPSGVALTESDINRICAVIKNTTA
jgi:dTDP-4-amino-4,6-dideoxygalactose transaminase